MRDRTLCFWFWPRDACSERHSNRHNSRLMEADICRCALHGDCAIKEWPGWLHACRATGQVHHECLELPEGTSVYPQFPFVVMNNMRRAFIGSTRTEDCAPGKTISNRSGPKGQILCRSNCAGADFPLGGAYSVISIAAPLIDLDRTYSRSRQELCSIHGMPTTVKSTFCGSPKTPLPSLPVARIPE